MGDDGGRWTVTFTSPKSVTDMLLIMVAEKHGINEVNFSFEGHKMERDRGIRFLGPKELEKGNVSMEIVSLHMGSNYSEVGMIRKVIQSIFHMVNNWHQFFAVGWIQDDNTVKGGTGWAVELAKLFNRPIHVYDQDRNTWFSWKDNEWVADMLDEKGIPYIGPNSLTMKQLIQKYETHRLMHENGVLVPAFKLVAAGDALPEVAYPAFVKPNCESRSIGISDESVVHNREELARRIRYVHETLEQAALIEEFLPGEEYTVLMLGNGRLQEILPGLVTVDKTHFGRHQVLRSDLRGVGLTKISIPTERAEEAKELTKKATDALKCWDHVRVDMRVDAKGRLRVMEINGIPGLKPVKSWSPQIYSLYHPSPGGPMEEYRNMVRLIVRSALERHGIG